MVDKAGVQEVLEIRESVRREIEGKVELKEVQMVLNDCQSDLCEQLASFKKSILD